MAIEYDSSRTALYSPEQRATVFASGMVYPPLQLAAEAARLAYIRAEESIVEEQRLADALARVGFAAPKLFIHAETGTQAFASYRDRDHLAIIAFRGTQPDKATDLAVDLQAQVVQWPESKGQVHAGFARAARAVLPEVRKWLEKQNTPRLILTGHSLGAALATLMATLFPSEWLVTLGSPRVGNADFAATVAAANIVRLVNCCDAVTEAPPPLFGYTHVGHSTYFTRNTARVENPTQAAVETDRQQARLEYFKEHTWRTGSVLVRDLADHAPINYLRALFS